MRAAVHLVLLAKLPRPGLAKTRLIPALGAEGAARLAERLLNHALDELDRLASGAAPGESGTHKLPSSATSLSLELCLAPSLDDPRVDAWRARHPRLQLQRQVEGDLGARMADAAQRGLKQADAAVLMGSDAPSLDAARIGQAIGQLTRHEAVMVPACDGGYALLGLRRFEPALFADMPWSTAAVAALTRQRLQAAGFALWEGEAVHDIDEAADLCHLPAGWIDRAP